VTAVNPAATAVSAARDTEEKDQAAEPGKPEDEGIEVHGHWVIDVRNPDPWALGDRCKEP